jgi:anti-anti-sigma factor
MASRFRIDTHQSPALTVLRVVGELDLTSAGELIARARAVASDGGSDERALVIDLRETGFMDSTGLRALLTVEESCRATARAFSVVRGPRQVDRMMTITHAAERLDVRDDVELPRG